MWDYISKGQVFMWPLLACSVMVVSVIIERLLAMRRARREAVAFLRDFDRLVMQGDLRAAKDLCRRSPQALAGLMLAGIELFEEMKGQHDVAFIHEQVGRGIEDQSAAVVGELEAHLGILASIATVAPLMGFLGTVTGMIEAFDAIAAANDINARIVAAGIAEALITTATGLIIAIPAVLGFNYFTKQVELITRVMEASANALLGQLVRSLDAGSRREGPSS